MIKILLANPRVETRPYLPLGLGYIAAVLDRSARIKIYDPPYIKSDKEIRTILQNFSPDIIGITCVTAQKEIAFHFAALTKEINKKSVVVMGGVHPTVAPQEVLANHNVDVVVMGEGEETIIELVECFNYGSDLSRVKGIGYKKNGKIFFTEPRPLIKNLDLLPFPARYLFNMEWYLQRNSLIRGTWLRTLTVITSRGCPGGCIFCTTSALFGRKLRQRSTQNVINEIEGLAKKYNNLEAIYFWDDVLTLNKDWIIELCHLIKERIPHLLWACQSRVDTIDYELIKVMKDCGCIQIEFGAESGSQKILDILQKGIKIEQTRRVFHICNELKMRTVANFMIGNPGETKEDVRLTKELAHDIKANYTDFFITTPYPGTELNKLAKEKGWLRNGKWFHHRESMEPVMEINIPQEKLPKLRKNLYESVSQSIQHDYLTNCRFIFDVIKFTVYHPFQIFGYLRILFREKSIIEVGRYINYTMSGNPIS